MARKEDEEEKSEEKEVRGALRSKKLSLLCIYLFSV